MSVYRSAVENQLGVEANRLGGRRDSHKWGDKQNCRTGETAMARSHSFGVRGSNLLRLSNDFRFFAQIKVQREAKELLFAHALFHRRNTELLTF